MLNNISFDTINVIILLVVLINLVYGLIVYSRNRSGDSNKLFFELVIAITFWSVTMVLYRGFETIELKILAARALYASAALIPYIFLNFSFLFLKSNYQIRMRTQVMLTLFYSAIVILSLYPNALILGVKSRIGNESVIIFNQTLHLIYALYIVLLFGWSYLNLYNTYRYVRGIERAQILLVILGTLTATFISLVTNLVLPLFGIFTLNWVGQVSVVIMVALISYAIMKHHLFAVNVIATELFTLALWGFILTRIIITNDAREAISNIGLFMGTVILGVFLIRSVRLEVETREKIERLLKELENANRKLKEIDRQKSEFVSIATHQLRSPLTAIKGYSSMILEGSFGSIGDILREAVDKIFKSSQSLVIVIDNFLNISRVEQNRMHYEFGQVDIGELAKAVIDQLMPNISAKGLTIRFQKAADQKYIIQADKEKIRQVILNILDNAVKYTPQGGIEMDIKADNDKICLSVSDTGLGMSKETVKKLFQKFVRADDAGKINPSGAGLGMYLACQIMKAHGGKIYALSKGEGKGSRFILEFDVKWRNESDKKNSPDGR